MFINLLSILQHKTKSIPVMGNKKKKNPNLRLPEETELTIKNKINPSIINNPPTCSRCQDKIKPTNIIRNEIKRNTSAVERVAGFGSPFAN